MPDHESWSTATALIHAGRPPREPGRPLSVPIEAASTYHAGGVSDYARDGTAGTAAVEEVVGLLEGGRAVAFSSGMAAADAILDAMPIGAHVVAPRVGYAGVSARLAELDRQGRIRLDRADLSDSTAALALLESSPGEVLWIESPSNPLLDVADIAALVRGAHAAGAEVVCDNTFATPLGQRPLDLGADMVMHSATKFLGGHSDLLLGVVVTRDEQRAADLVGRRTLLGAAPGALECFLAVRGMRTLPLRWARAQESAATLAERLRAHPRVTRVRYPGRGAIIAIEVTGGAEGADQVAGGTRLWVHATSLGGVESLIERRRRWAAESPEVPESLLRLSVGLEDPDDLWRDLATALDA